MTDLVQAIQFAVEKEGLHGPVNFVSPEPATNFEFTKELARVLDKPAFLPIPGFVLRMLPGDIAREALLASQRCQPAKLTQSGFKFEYADIGDALRNILAGAL
jgi:NAD dependent epimerase/dehydratase family enzyme